MQQLHLSARAFHRVLKLARTIADLAEAIQYRPKVGMEYLVLVKHCAMIHMMKIMLSLILQKCTLQSFYKGRFDFLKIP
jgi:hypothetical protein